MTVTRVAHGDRCAKLLLPGLPDEITLDLIAPKLPWRSVCMLSSVSLAWHQAVQTHKVYDARVRSRSTETLVLLNYYSRLTEKKRIALYSLIDNSCSELALIPGHSRQEIPRDCKGVSIDGKFYMLGGRYFDHDGFKTSEEVYMLDLAGQRQWKRCASLITPRFGFGCGVMHGKIYVFGGISSSTLMCTSEVYDPKRNIWSPIKPMPSTRGFNDTRVDVLGEEFIVYEDHTSQLAAYHPLTDEWRLLPFRRDKYHKILTLFARGKFHEFARGHFHKASAEFRISVNDVGEKKLWRHFHWQFDEALKDDPLIEDAPFRSSAFPLHVQVVGDELLAIAMEVESSQPGVLRIRGLGGENETTQWQKAHPFISSASWPYCMCSTCFMCPIQL